MRAITGLFEPCLSAFFAVQALREDAELRRKQDIHEVEERKNAHIQDLMKKHEKVGLSKAGDYCLLVGSGVQPLVRPRVGQHKTAICGWPWTATWAFSTTAGLHQMLLSTIYKAGQCLLLVTKTDADPSLQASVDIKTLISWAPTRSLRAHLLSLSSPAGFCRDGGLSTLMLRGIHPVLSSPFVAGLCRHQELLQ